ncbi:MAG: class A beta-lactamase-related serine hydrolase [Atopobiaceae bacterium]|nr:class A beta-lactamase-related serine hydrolase [Atopobiaceae bacterium]MCI2173985.1 class A beta-lactamase-related serine hydrolase [Atopobiaceae bacterium]MCI2207925.1 class A beta-lactamase-related serine hydrolase [Atopobiaceae bacterium]
MELTSVGASLAACLVAVVLFMVGSISNAVAGSIEDATVAQEEVDETVGVVNDAQGEGLADDTSTATETVASADEDQSLLDVDLTDEGLTDDEFKAALGAQSRAAAAAVTSADELASADLGEIEVEGVDASGAATQLQRLALATSELEGEGYTVSYELVDVSTGATISHDSDATVYSASSIKAPYVLYLEQNVVGSNQAGMRETIAECIENSDNDAYRTLHSTFGESGFASWVEACGCDLSDLSYHYYTDYSAADLVRIWTASYDFLVGGRTDQAVFTADILSNTLKSPIAAVTDGVDSWSKAGWYPDAESNAGPSTVDGGIVRADSGDYVVAVLTDDPEDFLAVGTLVACLDNAHTALMTA